MHTSDVTCGKHIVAKIIYSVGLVLCRDADHCSAINNLIAKLSSPN